MMKAKKHGDVLATGPNAQIPMHVELVGQTGIIRLPRRKVADAVRDERTGKVKHPEAYATDFSECASCDRCGGHALDNGSMAPSAGILSVLRINGGGVAFHTSAACSCVFGAFRHKSRTDEWGEVRGLQFADRLKDVPPGLTAEHWQWIRTCHTPGDQIRDVVERLPSVVRGAVGRAVQAWLRTDPPIYEPYPMRHQHTDTKPAQQELVKEMT